MKKIFVAAIAAFGIFMVSCSGSPEDKAEKIMKDCIEKVNKAKTAEDIELASTEMLTKTLELQKELSKEEIEALDDNEKLKELAEEYREVCAKKYKELR